MIARRIACSLAIATVAAVALIAIWNPDLLAPVYSRLLEAMDILLSAIVVVFAAAAIACCWRLVRKGAEEASCRSAECRAKRAALPNPYPEDYRKNSIVRFAYHSDLHLVRLKERLPGIGPEQQYIVARDYEVRYRLSGEKKMRSVIVPKGVLTDLSSSPWPFRWYVGRVGPHLEATIVHDYLYIAWQVGSGIQPTKQMRRFADDLKLAAMKETGMGCKAHVIYWAVRLFGSCIFLGRNPEPLILCSDRLPKCCRRISATAPARSRKVKRTGSMKRRSRTLGNRCHGRERTRPGAGSAGPIRQRPRRRARSDRPFRQSSPAA